MMKVCKFGGSSVADAETVAHVCDIILADPDRRIVVVSAPGKRDAADTKVTDMLIACAEQALAGAPTEEPIHHITERFRSDTFDLDPIMDERQAEAGRWRCGFDDEADSERLPER